MSDDVRVGHGAQQIAHQIVEFMIGDEMGGLLVAQEPPSTRDRPSRALLPQARQ